MERPPPRSPTPIMSPEVVPLPLGWYTTLLCFNTLNIHVFALTETWLTPISISAEIFYAILHRFTFLSTPRPVSDTCTSSVVGGGTRTAFLIREPCTLLSSPTTTFKSFEMSTVTLKLPHSKLNLFNI
jgi:hypothetical protein